MPVAEEYFSMHHNFLFRVKEIHKSFLYYPKHNLYLNMPRFPK